MYFIERTKINLFFFSFHWNKIFLLINRNIGKLNNLLVHIVAYIEDKGPISNKQNLNHFLLNINFGENLNIYLKSFTNKIDIYLNSTETTFCRKLLLNIIITLLHHLSSLKYISWPNYFQLLLEITLVDVGVCTSCIYTYIE